jgi:hypothetical protein
MARYEYKVVPAPKKGRRGKGVKGPEGRFANALETVMNELGAEGWEYQRTDTLPAEERQGLTGRTTVFQNMLVFRRTLGTAEEAFEPKLIERADPVIEAPAPEPIPQPEPGAGPEGRVGETLEMDRTEPPLSAEPRSETAEEADRRHAAE